MAGAKRPDYARMRVPALSVQSLPPASVAEGRAANVFNPRMFPGASDTALNDLFIAVRTVTRAQTDAFQKGLAGAKHVELVGASHHDFLSHPGEVLSRDPVVSGDAHSREPITNGTTAVTERPWREARIQTTSCR